MGETIEYTEGGKTYPGYLAVPEAGRGPGVVVIHAWWLMEKLDQQEAKASLSGAMDYLHHHASTSGDGLGAVGFSLGAAYAILLSTWRPADFRAVVLFYGTEFADFTRSRADFQGHFAQVDEWEPIEGVYRLEENIKLAGRQEAFYIYPDAGHWFFEQNRPADYKPEAARLAWERALSFLREKLT